MTRMLTIGLLTPDDPGRPTRTPRSGGPSAQVEAAAVTLSTRAAGIAPGPAGCARSWRCCVRCDRLGSARLRYHIPPPAPFSRCTLRIRRLPLSTRRDRAGCPLVLALRAVLSRRRRVARRARGRGRPRQHLPVDGAVHAAAGRRRQAMPPHPRGPMACGRDVCAGRWRYVYRAIDQFGQVIDVFVSPRRDTKSARPFFERAICAIKVTPVEVTTDQAPVYPAVLEALVPVAWHHTDQYANNRVECDHGRLKARLRPMRGLKQDRRAAGLQRQSDRRRARFRTEPSPRPLRVGGGGADDQAAGGGVRRADLSGLICGGVVNSACSGSAQRNNALDEYLRHYNDQRPHRSLALRPPRGIEVRAGPDAVTGAARVRRRDRLGGLVHEYYQVAA
jgi:hypothetical protein